MTDFHPTFTLSGRLLTSITKIERMYGQIEALRIPKKLELNLTRDNLIQSSYASNKIEGNPMTLPEVTNLILDDRVPANRNEQEVRNYFDILTHIMEYEPRPLTVNLITEFHRKLLGGIDDFAGSIRNAKVVVGRYKKDVNGDMTLRVKHDPPYHTREDISAALKTLITWYNNNDSLPAVIAAGIFHHEFVYIHPFEDGNGRVCRLMTALIFIQRHYLINKYFVLDDYYDIDRQQYSDMLHSADEGDKTKWLEYFADGVRYSLQSALFRVENAMKTLSISQRPTPKEQEVLRMFEAMKELTSTDVARKLDVSRQQAFNLLKSLVNKGLLMRHGTTKASYYTMK